MARFELGFTGPAPPHGPFYMVHSKRNMKVLESSLTSRQKSFLKILLLSPFVALATAFVIFV